MFSIRVNGNHGTVKKETLKEILIEAKKVYKLFQKDVFIHENGEHIMTLKSGDEPESYGTLELTCNCEIKQQVNNTIFNKLIEQQYQYGV